MQSSANQIARETHVWYLKIIFIIVHLLSVQRPQCFLGILMWEKQTSI